jgi:enoyl-CoA hydratase
MFSLPEVKLGLIPAYGGTQRLRREIGARASELLFTGRPIDARTAEELGLVNRVVAEADVLHESIALAREIEQLAPLAIRACLKAVTLGWDLPLEKGLELEREMFASLFATEDAREGTRAFLEKRRPEFKGR